MSRYRLRQKFFAFGDDYTIQDEHGNDAFFVDGKMLSLGDKLSFRDMRGSELARIRERLLTIGKTYDIEWSGGPAAGSLAGGTQHATVQKHLFTFFRAAFTIDVPGPGDLEAQGNLTDHEYTFTRGGKTVATVSKQWFALNDTYGVDVAPGEDEVLILASAVVIDLCCHPDEKGHQS